MSLFDIHIIRFHLVKFTTDLAPKVRGLPLHRSTSIYLFIYLFFFGGRGAYDYGLCPK